MTVIRNRELVLGCAPTCALEYITKSKGACGERASVLQVGVAVAAVDRIDLGERLGRQHEGGGLPVRLELCDRGGLGCHGTQYAWYGRGWYAYPVRTVRGALGASRPAPPVRTQRGRLVRVACTYPTEAPGRTCQLSGRQTERAPCASAAARAASNVECSC